MSSDFYISKEGWIFEGPFLRAKEERNPIPPGGRCYTEGDYKYAGTFSVHQPYTDAQLIDIYFNYPKRRYDPLAVAFSKTAYDGFDLGRRTFQSGETNILHAAVFLFEDYMRSNLVPWWSFAV